LDDDNESWSSDSMRHPANMPLPPSTANSASNYREPPHSPVDPSVPFIPAGSRGAPPNYQDNPRQMYQGQVESRPNSDLPLINNGGSPTPYRDNASATNLSAGYRSQQNASPSGFRNQNNASPWQRGAGYDH